VTTLFWCGAITASSIVVNGLAATTPTPYRNIIERNIFALKPPPPAPAAVEPEKPRPKIILTGITTILGDKRVLMKVAPTPGAPGDSPKEQLYILAEGQEAAGIRVLEVSITENIVKLSNGGVIELLKLDETPWRPPPPPPLPPAVLPVKFVR
jgi:hypothetical protein